MPVENVSLRVQSGPFLSLFLFPYLSLSFSFSFCFSFSFSFSLLLILSPSLSLSFSFSLALSSLSLLPPFPSSLFAPSLLAPLFWEMVLEPHWIRSVSSGGPDPSVRRDGWQTAMKPLMYNQGAHVNQYQNADLAGKQICPRAKIILKLLDVIRDWVERKWRHGSVRQKLHVH